MANNISNTYNKHTIYTSITRFLPPPQDSYSPLSILDRIQSIGRSLSFLSILPMTIQEGFSYDRYTPVANYS